MSDIRIAKCCGEYPVFDSSVCMIVKCAKCGITGHAFDFPISLQSINDLVIKDWNRVIDEAQGAKKDKWISELSLQFQKIANMTKVDSMAFSIACYGNLGGQIDEMTPQEAFEQEISNWID